MEDVTYIKRRQPLYSEETCLRLRPYYTLIIKSNKNFMVTVNRPPDQVVV